jgi:hypothetical protein
MPLIIKPWRVQVSSFPAYTYFARSRQKALSAAWDSYCSYSAISFKDFLKIARARAEEPMGRFGEYIEVAGLPAYLVSYDRQYIQFVRPDSELILSSHPYDVQPPEARRGTAYYTPTPERKSDE